LSGQAVRLVRTNLRFARTYGALVGSLRSAVS